MTRRAVRVSLPRNGLAKRNTLGGLTFTARQHHSVHPGRSPFVQMRKVSQASHKPIAQCSVLIQR
jgi:hypothetical protein